TFIGAALLSGNNDPTSPIALMGFVLIMIGLILSGPWLIRRIVGVMTRLVNSASLLLAVRRLADNPKAAFRSVSGLVLAVFVGTVFTTMAPAVLAEQKTPKFDALSNVLAAKFYSTGHPECADDDICGEKRSGDGLSAEDSAKLLERLQSYHGIEVFPIYVSSRIFPVPEPKQGDAGNEKAPESIEAPFPGRVPMNTIISCKDLDKLKVLGHCPAGMNAITSHADGLLDNQDRTPEPIVYPYSQAVTDNYTRNSLRAVLVRVNDASSLEKVRTLLARNTGSPSSDVPRTFGEVRQDQLDTATTIQRFVFVAMVLTLLIAGCSLAVSVGGSLVERKRPFTLLRLSGTPVRALYGAVLWESLVPLVAVTTIAALLGFGLSVLMIAALAPAGTPILFPDASYYLTMAAGLLISALVVCATLPLLRRITTPDNARFE
ncbi:MAG TPA: FtsX-like permease family protein, partial [Candidatus Saccharimonadales bacterium]|nr:FtsX-like permease family protein [Candidatus Saccharimonadales bacterium]